jgi:hypothetical protein
VPFFPGRQLRLFPEFDEELIKQKRLEYEKSIFVEKIAAQVLVFEKEASGYNEDILKETVTIQEILDRIYSRLKLEVTAKQIQTSDNLNLFGSKKLLIMDYYYPPMDKYLLLEINLNIVKVNS